MKNLSKKLILLGALVASMALVACGEKPAEQSQSEKPASTEKVDVLPEEPDEPDLPDDPTLPMHTVTFDDGSGSPVQVQVRHNRKVARPATDPVAPAGKKFFGWMRQNAGGQIWNFNRKALNAVLEDMTLVPCFVDDIAEQSFEAEYCPDILNHHLDDDGNPVQMHGATYSGGADGKQLIYKDYDYEYSASHKLGAKDAKGKFLPGGFVHFMYEKGDTLTWKLSSDKAATNVTLFMRLNAEYAKEDETGEKRYSIDSSIFPIKVNGESLNYGTITFRQIPPVGGFLPCQDFFVSATVSLKEGENVIQMIVDNEVNIFSTAAATAPCVDCIKLYSSSTLTWPEEQLSNMSK